MMVMLRCIGFSCTSMVLVDQKASSNVVSRQPRKSNDGHRHGCHCLSPLGPSLFGERWQSGRRDALADCLEVVVRDVELDVLGSRELFGQDFLRN